jgi:hypothetical protein
MKLAALICGLVAGNDYQLESCNNAETKAIEITVSVSKDAAGIDGGTWTLNTDTDRLQRSFAFDDLTNDGQTGTNLVFSTPTLGDGPISCNYSLNEQTLESSQTVSNYNHDSGLQLTEEGLLAFTFEAVETETALGNRVRFAIVPTNEGVVYARPDHCWVTNSEGVSYDIFGGERNGPFCANSFISFTADSGFGSANRQEYSYNAFKWHDLNEESVDSQTITCKLQLRSIPFAEIDITACDGTIVTTSTSLTTPPTEPPTLNTTTSTTTTTTTVYCSNGKKGKQCRNDRKKAINKARKAEVKAKKQAAAAAKKLANIKKKVIKQAERKSEQQRKVNQTVANANLVSSIKKTYYAEKKAFKQGRK